jgi:FkbM family methyltransferase
MVKRILRKNLNLFKNYGIFGLLSIYIKAIRWYLYHISAGGTAKYKKVKVNNYYMDINLKDRGISKALFIYGVREKDQMHIIENNLSPGAKVLDIGANIGYYVILESNIMGPSAKIIAYEPSADNFLLLKRNVELNNLADNVEINNAAVSDKSGVSKFYLSDKSNLHTLNRVHYRKSAFDMKEQRAIDVATVDIYEIINKHRDIKFIRMDIEGHEVEVLGGLAKAVRDFDIYPDILFETHFSKYDSTRHDMGDKLRMLFDLGYSPNIMTSTDERRAKLRQRYNPNFTISTDRVNRGIYRGISKEDALDFICNIGGVRAVLLKRT